MFANHQPIIGEWARAEPRNFALTATFVICTIRVPLERAIMEYHAYRDHGDVAALWGWKLQAVRDMEENATQRLTALHKRHLGRPGDDDAMLALIVSWLGVSYAKGGFLLQLTHGLSGCIDSHNERRLGVNLRAEGLTASPKRPPTRTRKARRYNHLVRSAGGTEKLWDDWCNGIAANRPDVWSDGFEVSRNHALAVLPSGELDTSHVGSDIPF
jgi:hypothetical protein